LEPWSPEPKASLDLEPEQKCCFWLNGALEPQIFHLEALHFLGWSPGALNPFGILLLGLACVGSISVGLSARLKQFFTLWWIKNWGEVKKNSRRGKDKEEEVSCSPLPPPPHTFLLLANHKAKLASNEKNPMETLAMQAMLEVGRDIFWNSRY